MNFSQYLYKDFVAYWVKHLTSVQEDPGSNPTKVSTGLIFTETF